MTLTCVYIEKTCLRSYARFISDEANPEVNVKGHFKGLWVF